ncbi:uncharacterized protein LOC141880739 isoform X2 [Acropora palmata]|uniref:uncharacterized protein LOC141880739 isoform X2 n=1 Tax=Acropora palmata TaxID=6131 RepID=UPI003DA1AC74
MRCSCCLRTLVLLACTILGVFHSVSSYKLANEPEADALPEKSPVKCSPYDLGSCYDPPAPRVGRREKLAELKRGIDCKHPTNHDFTVCDIFLGKKRELENVVSLQHQDTVVDETAPEVPLLSKKVCKPIFPWCRGPGGKKKYRTEKRKETALKLETPGGKSDESGQKKCSYLDLLCLGGRRTLFQDKCTETPNHPMCRWFGRK